MSTKADTYYGYGQPDYVTGHAEGSGSSIHNIDEFQPPHGYPRIYPDYQSPHDIYQSRSTPQGSYMQEYGRSSNNNFSPDSYRIKGKERQSQDFGQSLDSGIKSLKGKERQYQDFEESLDGETDEDKILNPEVPKTSPRRSGLGYEGLLKKLPMKYFDTVGDLTQWAQNWDWSQGYALKAKSQKQAELCT
ncbi:hypothetical protein PPACK8108_LOCUS5523 [Phakopsora pachyrhizi]|uniref:Uncharacterized protein n=1 Tax=Phakopsora pachyrhizi TaxID=170000 RepID=A0AAV0AR39_PHAPC|nr:hypothetical protein PPACK8108_LOCUS5523 [Phakopsora pachyrhizi]